MPGYDRSRIVGESVEHLKEFICGICLGVFIKPTFTQCCGQTYCFDCINEWIHKHNTCPNDREVLTTDQLKSPPKLVTNLLNNMRIKCDFHENGCKAVLKINDLVKHKEIVCVFNPSRYCDNCGEIKLNHSDKDCIKRLVTKLDDLHKENDNLRELENVGHINYEKLKVDFERSERMNGVLKTRVDQLQKEYELTESVAQESNDPNVVRSGASSVKTSSGTEVNPLESLRTQPQFQQTLSVIQQNPQLLNGVIQLIAQNNPQLLQLIVQNQEAFVRMINESTSCGGQTPTAGAQPATTGQPILTKEGKNDKPRLSPWAYFVQSCREEHKKKHPNGNVVFAEFFKKCAQQWRAMNDKEKNSFKLLAKKAEPKSPLSTLLCKDEPPPLRDNMNDPTVGEVYKEIGRRWNEEQKSIRRPKALADICKARYEYKMKAYKAKEGKPAPVPKKQESDDGEEDKEENAAED